MDGSVRVRGLRGGLTAARAGQINDEKRDHHQINRDGETRLVAGIVAAVQKHKSDEAAGPSNA